MNLTQAELAWLVWMHKKKTLILEPGLTSSQRIETGHYTKVVI